MQTALRLAAGALNESTKQHHRGKIGLGHKTLTQLFHHHRQVDDVAAKTAVFLGERNREPAQLGEKLPVIPAHALIRGNNGLAGVPVVVVLNKARDRVADHLLLFGKIKIHGLESPYSRPSTYLAMMFFCTSLEPP